MAAFHGLGDRLQDQLVEVMLTHFGDAGVGNTRSQIVGARFDLSKCFHWV